MAEGPSPQDSSKKFRISPLAIVAVLAAVVIGGAAGAFAYRQHSVDKADNAASTASAAVEVVTGQKVANNGAPGNKYDAQFNTESMFPTFSPDRHSYVTRCVPGKIRVQVKANEGSTVKVGPYPPDTGRFVAEARPLPGQDFNIVIDTNGKSQTYQVRCLADDFPSWSYTRLSDPPKGMFFISSALSRRQPVGTWAIVFDQDGMPVWWFSPPTNTLGGQVLPDKTFQIPRGFGDGYGKDPRTGSEIRSLDGKFKRLVTMQGAPTDGHEYTYLPNGNAIMNSYTPRKHVDLSSVGGPKDVGVYDGELQEITPSGKIVWQWSSADHVPLSATPKRWWKKVLANAHPDANGDEFIDYFHLNSAEPWGKYIVISTRHTDKVFGINKKTGEIAWTLGGDQNPKSLKILGDDPHADYPLSGNHDARISDGNLLSIHDNATDLGRPPRAPRYRLDIKAGTATYEGQVDDPQVKESHCCGSARPFGDGWIVSWGNTPLIDGFNSKDKLAFRLRPPIPAYRAVPVPKQVTTADLNKAMDAMENDPPMSKVPVNPIEHLGQK
ncbi:MAG: aryl-sulfate sulfotransferase [Solirubrobacterales bacterium]|nr:aryl-sulfate sulfotransferase [Solirubrobacterales bacterium]